MEYLVKEAYFISNKTYCLLLENGETIIKAKGVLNKSLKLKDFKDMYYSKIKVKERRIESKTEYDKGSVTIFSKNIIINSDSYLKRTKLYNSDGIWIDTKPLNFKEIDDT